MNWCKDWRVAENKSLEVQFDWLRYPYGDRLSSWFLLDIDIRTECDHAGAHFGIALLRLFYFGITFYDHRHWPHDDEPLES